MNYAGGPVLSMCGYLDVKQAKTGGAKFKSWEKLYVILRPMTDMAAGRPVVTMHLYADKAASAKKFASKNSMVLDTVTSVRRARSRSHQFAFSVNIPQPLIYFSAQSETESQRWMIFLRHIFWPPVLMLEPRSEFFEVSVVENNYAEKLDLTGNYWLHVGPTSIRLYDIRDNSELMEWKMGSLRRFFLASAEVPCDSEKMLVIEAGPRCNGGEGDLMIFSDNASTILQNIMKRIHDVLNRKSDTPTRVGSATSTVLRGFIESNHQSESRASIFSDDSSRLSTCSSVTDLSYQPHKKLVRSTSLVSQELEWNVGPTKQPLTRTNSVNPGAMSSVRTSVDGPSDWVMTKDINKWVNECDPSERGQLSVGSDKGAELMKLKIQRTLSGSMGSPDGPRTPDFISTSDPCNPHEIVNDSLRSELYEAIGILDTASNRDIQSPTRESFSDSEQVVRRSSNEMTRVGSDLESPNDRRRKVSSDSTHLISNSEENIDTLSKCKSTNDIRSNVNNDEDIYAEVSTLRSFQKDLTSFFGTDKFQDKTPPQTPPRKLSVRRRERNAKAAPEVPSRTPPKSSSPKFNKRNPFPDQPPKLPDRPLFLPLRGGRGNSPSTIPSPLSKSVTPIREWPLQAIPISENAVDGDQPEEEEIYAELSKCETPQKSPPSAQRSSARIKSAEIRTTNNTKVWELKKPDTKSQELSPQLTPPLSSSPNSPKPLSKTESTRRRFFSRKSVKPKRAPEISPDPFTDYENMPTADNLDADLLLYDKPKAPEKSKKKAKQISPPVVSTASVPVKSTFDSDLVYVEEDPIREPTYSSFMMGKKITETEPDSLKLMVKPEYIEDEYDIIPRPIALDSSQLLGPASGRGSPDGTSFTDSTDNEKGEFLPIPEPITQDDGDKFDEDPFLLYDTPTSMIKKVPPVVVPKPKQPVPSIPTDDVNPISTETMDSGDQEDLYDAPRRITPMSQAKLRKVGFIGTNESNKEDSNNNDESLYDVPGLNFANIKEKFNRKVSPSSSSSPRDIEHNKLTRKFSDDRMYRSSKGCYLDKMVEDEDLMTLNKDYENIYIDMSGQCKIINTDGTETYAGSV